LSAVLIFSFLALPAITISFFGFTGNTSFYDIMDLSAPAGAQLAAGTRMIQAFTVMSIIAACVLIVVGILVILGLLPRIMTKGRVFGLAMIIAGLIVGINGLGAMMEYSPNNGSGGIMLLLLGIAMVLLPIVLRFVPGFKPEKK